jgi:MFS family permease
MVAQRRRATRLLDEANLAEALEEELFAPRQQVEPEARSLLRVLPRTALVLALLWCLALGSYALSGSYALALALLFVAGFVDLSFNSMAQALVQLHTPPSMRGRTLGVFSMAASGMRVFSGIAVGFRGGLIGIHGSLLILVLILLASSPRAGSVYDTKDSSGSGQAPP